MKIYYAHSIALYGSIQEKRDKNMLEALGFDVVMPNTPENDLGYRERGMDHFEKIISESGGVAFRANPDGSINAGVAKEITWARYYGKALIELPSMIERRALTVAQTRHYLEEQGYR